MKKELFFTPDAKQWALTWTLLEHSEPEMFRVTSIEIDYHSSSKIAYDVNIHAHVTCEDEQVVFMNVRFTRELYTTYTGAINVRFVCSDDSIMPFRRNQSTIDVTLETAGLLFDAAGKNIIPQEDAAMQLIYWIVNNAKAIEIEINIAER